jgi:hypothetical protein
VGVGAVAHRVTGAIARFNGWLASAAVADNAARPMVGQKVDAASVSAGLGQIDRVGEARAPEEPPKDSR